MVSSEAVKKEIRNLDSKLELQDLCRDIRLGMLTEGRLLETVLEPYT